MCTVSTTMPLDDDAWKRMPYYDGYYGYYSASSSSTQQPQRQLHTQQSLPAAAPAPAYSTGYPHTAYSAPYPAPRSTGYYYPTTTPVYQHVEPTRAVYPQRDMLVFDSDLDEMRMLQEMLLTPYPGDDESKESHVAMLLAANDAVTASTSTPTSAPTTPHSEISSCDSQRLSTASSIDESPRSSIASYTRSTRARSIPPSRVCRVPDCTKGIRSRGLCKAHGGGRRCQTPGCNISDQGGGHCIAHGGGKRCTTAGCDKSAQFKGLCKVHGGSRRCRVTECDKNGQIKGLCRHHYTQSVQQQQRQSGSSDQDDDSDH